MLLSNLEIFVFVVIFDLKFGSVAHSDGPKFTFQPMLNLELFSAPQHFEHWDCSVCHSIWLTFIFTNS